MHGTLRSTKHSLLRNDSAQSLLETALVLPVLVLMLVGAVDFGRAYYAAIEVQNAAEAGALYGSANSSDTTGMQNAALADAVDVPTLAATGSWGCQCADGSGASGSCAAPPTCASSNVVEYATVNTSATYNSILRYPGVPASLALTGTATMRSGQ